MVYWTAEAYCSIKWNIYNLKSLGKRYYSSRNYNKDSENQLYKEVTWEEKKKALIWFFLILLSFISLIIYIIYRIYKWWTYVEPPFPPELPLFRIPPRETEDIIASVKWFGLDVLPAKLQAMFNPTAVASRDNVFTSIPHYLRTFYVLYPDYLCLYRRAVVSTGIGISFDNGVSGAFVHTAITIYTKCGPDGTRIFLLMYKSMDWDISRGLLVEYCSSSITYSWMPPDYGYTNVIRLVPYTYDDAKHALTVIDNIMYDFWWDPEETKWLNPLYRMEAWVELGKWIRDPYYKYDNAAFG